MGFGWILKHIRRIEYTEKQFSECSKHVKLIADKNILCMRLDNKNVQVVHRLRISWTKYEHLLSTKRKRDWMQ